MDWGEKRLQPGYGFPTQRADMAALVRGVLISGQGQAGGVFILVIVCEGCNFYMVV